MTKSDGGAQCLQGLRDAPKAQEGPEHQGEVCGRHQQFQEGGFRKEGQGGTIRPLADEQGPQGVQHPDQEDRLEEIGHRSRRKMSDRGTTGYPAKNQNIDTDPGERKIRELAKKTEYRRAV